MNDKKISMNAQNRLIISGLLLSTILIICIAIFAIFNIQNKLDESYQSFGRIISKALAVESTELSKKMPYNDSLNAVKAHADTILHGHSDILYIKITDVSGNEIYNKKGDAFNDFDNVKRNVTVNSQIMSPDGKKVLGNVIVGFSGVGIEQIFSTTRASMIFVFLIAWIVFAFVVLINTYLITRELRILKDGVGKISSGEFGYTIEGKDVSEEVEGLFNSFNNMSAKLHVYEEQNIEQLTLERNKLEAVLMSIANGVVVCDYNDNVVLLNKHAKMLLEVDEENFLNKKIQDYADTSGNYCFKDKIEQYKSAKPEEILNNQIEFNIKIDERTIKSIISPMFTRNNDYVGYIIVLIDMTKEAEMDLMRANFISNVSHELRTPVTVLRSYIDTLYTMGDEFDEGTKKEFIEIINKEIIRLNNMVNDILDFSRLESGVKIEKEENNIVELVETCVNSVNVLLEEHKIKLTIHKDDDIPILKFNYNSIERAFTNLVSNAIKYSPDGSNIDVYVRKLPNNSGVEVSVKDEGCGIAPEYQKKVFDRFFRVENSAHTIKGTGLGLNLVKTTIERYHGGEVFVESKVGEGSTFGFRLPYEE